MWGLGSQTILEAVHPISCSSKDPYYSERDTIRPTKKPRNGGPGPSCHHQEFPQDHFKGADKGKAVPYLPPVPSLASSEGTDCTGVIFSLRVPLFVSS